MIIGLSGYARSGKDTIAEYLKIKYRFGQYSFADPMRKAMSILDPMVDPYLTYNKAIETYGYTEAKQMYPEVRRLLQVFGTEVGREMFGENFWVDICLNNIHSFHAVISDVRFPNEADSIKERGGVIWRINRPDLQPVTRHSSETSMDNYGFDAVIDNDKSIGDLCKLVDLEIVNALKQ